MAKLWFHLNLEMLLVFQIFTVLTGNFPPNQWHLQNLSVTPTRQHLRVAVSLAPQAVGGPGSTAAPVPCRNLGLLSDGKVVAWHTVYSIQELKRKETNSFIFHWLRTGCLFAGALEVSNLGSAFTAAGIFRVLKFLEWQPFILPDDVPSKLTVLCYHTTARESLRSVWWLKKTQTFFFFKQTNCFLSPNTKAEKKWCLLVGYDVRIHAMWPSFFFSCFFETVVYVSEQHCSIDLIF